MERLPGGIGAAFAEAADGSRGLSFLADIPLIDAAAAGLGTYVQATDDIDKGESPTRAWIEDGIANVGGIAAGAAAGAAVTGAVAGAVAGAPVVAVGAGVVVGGVVAIGVGDLVYNGLHEHWDADIQEHGVVMGVLDGTGHVFADTGEDLKDLGEGAVDGVKSVWHGVFGRGPARHGVRDPTQSSECGGYCGS